MTQPDEPNEVRRLPVTGVSPEVLAAIEHLSVVTGLSKAWLIRSILTKALVDLGLVADSSSPTPTRRK